MMVKNNTGTQTANRNTNYKKQELLNQDKSTDKNRHTGADEQRQMDKIVPDESSTATSLYPDVEWAGA